MLTQTLEPELRRLQNDVLVLGRLVEHAIVEAVDLLRQRAPTGSQPLITLDHRITKKRFAIELDCITFIAAQQPPDSELHAVTAMLEIATELERIGDCITNIAQIHFMIARLEPALLDLLGEVRRMAVETQAILRQALDAYADMDLALAQAVYAKDERIDAFYRRIYREMLILMRGQPRGTVKQVRYLSQIARNLERVGDRVNNICEWTIFAVTGELVPTEVATEPVTLYEEELV